MFKKKKKFKNGKGVKSDKNLRINSVDLSVLGCGGGYSDELTEEEKMKITFRENLMSEIYRIEDELNTYEKKVCFLKEIVGIFYVIY